MEVRPKNNLRSCPICRDPIDPLTAFRCPVCGQLYHSHCWSYNNNQCGVLGCNGRTFLTDGTQVTRRPQITFGAIVFIGILCAMVGLLGGLWFAHSLASLRNFISTPIASPSPQHALANLPAPEIKPTAIVLTSTSTQPTTMLPTANIGSTDANLSLSQPLSPEQLITDYFNAINNRQYELAWSMLSDKFQANYTYSEYTSWWKTLENVEVISITIKSQNNSEVYIYVEAYYYYKSGDKTTGHTTYKLVKNETGNSWLFDPN
jgi:hypothetical protein